MVTNKMSEEKEFVGWPKIPRINRIFGRCIISEKIDGTNAHVKIDNGEIVAVGSRKRWITVENDNFGFAAWVKENEQELLKLGDGHHFGEWYGSGIQRGYGLTEKRWALFNSLRWNDQNPNRPQCCDCVPILHQGDFSFEILKEVQENLWNTGSFLVSGQKPEGVIVYFSEMDQLAKWTYDYTEGKWANE